jgi:amino acid transporter
MIAAPVIALIFILGTSSVLAFVQPDQIDLISPISQVLRLGFRSFGFVGDIVTIVILLTLALLMAQASFIFTATTRLPMVAGWDRLLPQWFCRLHARFRTPSNSIFFVGALSLGIALAVLVGVGHQEAYQLLWNASGILYGLTYLVMFTIPLIGLRGVTPRPPVWLRVASGSGLLMTLLYVALSIFPIIEVKSWSAFTTKITAVILIHNFIGAAIFLIARRRSTTQIPDALTTSTE